MTPAEHISSSLVLLEHVAHIHHDAYQQARLGLNGILTHVGLARPDVDANSLATLCLTIGVLLARLKIEASIDGRINVSRRGAA